MVCHWLVASPLEAFQLATQPGNRDVNLSTVSLGTLVQLGMFVQHQFSFIICDYCINATFQNDRPLLHVDLRLNHRDTCEARVTEYRSIVPYLSILRVLINEKNRLVEMFLHLKISVMLMGELVSDIPSRPGSAEAAALLGWDHHLAIGCDSIGGPVRTASHANALQDHSLAKRFIAWLAHRSAHGTLFC
ncbi:hypothetical protein MTO96_012769 [Rhipicephalus appendiculatus]